MGMIGNSLAQGLISGANIQDGTVDTPDIKDSAVTAAKIASAVITPAKLSTGAPTWDTSSNFGIGTASPSVRLHVASGITSYTSSLADSVTNAVTLLKTHSSDSTVTSFGGTSSGAATIQRSNGSGTTAYDLLLNPFGGNVGIGVASPTQKLTVVGNIKAGYDANTGINFGLVGAVPSSDTNAYILWGTDTVFGGTNGDVIYIPRTSTTASHRFYTGSGTPAERVRIDASGVFLVGATSSSGSGGVILKGYSGTSLAYNNNAGVLWSDQGNIVLTSAYASVNFPATASVSNANPYWMTGTVGGSGAGYYINLRSGYSGGGGGDVAAYKITNGGTATAATVTNHIWTVGSGTEAARINASGFFKATNTGGYINASGPYYEFISNDVSVNQTFIVYNNSSSITQDALFFVGAARGTTNNTFYAIGYYNYASSTYKFRVADSGNVTNTNGSYGAISDVKLKENITDATPKLAQLNQVRVVNYNFIGSNEKQLGVVAQELEQIFPGMVEESPDTERVTTVGEDGQEVTNEVPTGTTTKSVKYSVFVPMLIKAIQEQQAIIESLTERITALETQ
jgi:hypothetical protein